MKPYTWQQYSKKVLDCILKPMCMGSLDAREGMRLVIGEERGLKIYFLVDESDGEIADAKFQAFGPTALVGAAEIVCRESLRKNHAQVARFTADFIDQGFPSETHSYLNHVMAAVEGAMMLCQDIPLPDSYVAPPMPSMGGEASEYPGFSDLSDEKKCAVIEQVIDNDIRPYIELDEGGIRIVELKGNEIIIAYEGTCTSCYSAVGATLNSIQQIVQTRVHPELTVRPDPSSLTFQ